MSGRAWTVGLESGLDWIIGACKEEEEGEGRGKRMKEQVWRILADTKKKKTIKSVAQLP